MKIIAIVNQKGGVGKTTTTVELAASLYDMGKKVLTIDYDQQCNLTQYSEVNNLSDNIYEVIRGQIAVENAIQDCGKYHIIAGSEKLSKADREFIDHDDIFLLKDVIELTDDKYDYVFIDTNPARNILQTMAFVAADYIIIPTECDDGSINGVVTTYKDLVKLRQSRNHLSTAEIVNIILTKYEKTSMHNLAEEDLKEFVEKEMEESPSVFKVRKSIVASETKKMGQSLQEYKKYSSVAMDYRKIATELVERDK